MQQMEHFSITFLQKLIINRQRFRMVTDKAVFAFNIYFCKKKRNMSPENTICLHVTAVLAIPTDCARINRGEPRSTVVYCRKLTCCPALFGQVRYDDEDEDEGPQPDATLEQGAPIPVRMQGAFPPELASTPLEDIDPYYHNQRVSNFLSCSLRRCFSNVFL